MTLKSSIIGVRINEKFLGTEWIEVGNDPFDIQLFVSINVSFSKNFYLFSNVC